MEARKNLCELRSTADEYAALFKYILNQWEDFGVLLQVPSPQGNQVHTGEVRSLSWVQGSEARLVGLCNRGYNLRVLRLRKPFGRKL